jgi:hypothetical protein
MDLSGFYGALWACYYYCARGVSTCKEEKATFALVLLCLFACPVCLSFALCRFIMEETAKKKRPFVGRFSLGLWLWCLVSPIERK